MLQILGTCGLSPCESFGFATVVIFSGGREREGVQAAPTTTPPWLPMWHIPPSPLALLTVEQSMTAIFWDTYELHLGWFKPAKRQVAVKNALTIHVEQLFTILFHVTSSPVVCCFMKETTAPLPGLCPLFLSFTKQYKATQPKHNLSKTLIVGSLHSCP